MNQGIVGLRILYPVTYKIWRALKSSNADIYYVRCASYLPGIVAYFSKVKKKKMVYAGAHDTDFIPSKFLLEKSQEKILYKYGLQNADVIITQSITQKLNTWKYFNRESEVIRNYYPYSPKRTSHHKSELILWVSTLRPWKRPLHFLDLASSFPSEKFVMIGGRPNLGGFELYNEVEQKAKKIPNLEFLGFQPLHITERYFDNCKVFINTSVYEGFPNTFLQAWSRGIPVISQVDPDDVIKTHNLGYAIQSANQLKSALSRFLFKANWDHNAIVRYFSSNHSDGIIDRYESLFLNLYSDENMY